MQNRLGAIPENTTVTKKGLAIAGLVVIAVLTVFILLLKLSSPVPRISEKNAEPLDFTVSEFWLQGHEKKSEGELQKAQKPIDNLSPVIVVEPVENNDEVFQLGSESPISVYRAEPQQTSHEVDAQQPNVKTLEASTRLLNYESNLSDYEIKAGSVIPAILQVEINSDLPGAIIAKVRLSVFDTKTGDHLLIPQGTTLLGQYDSSISYGQERILIVWDRLIFPNGDSFDLQKQPGIDGLGRSGLKDKVNRHAFKLFGSSALFSILSAGSALSTSHYHDESDPQAVMGQALGQQMAETGMTLANKNLNIQPTLTIRAGTHFNVLLKQDLVFPNVYRDA